MLKEFKEFAMKGNMLDLAVGFILGAAFSTIIKSLVADIIMPVIAAIFGEVDFSNLYIQLTGTDPGTLEKAREAGVVLAYGNFITAFINFLLVAFALFLVVKSINKMKRQQEEAPAAPPAPTKDQELLGEIRDLLKK